jgi:hypothetical protein
MTLWALLARFVQFCKRGRVARIGTMEGEQLIDRHQLRGGRSARTPAIQTWYEEEPAYLKTAAPKNF